MTRASLIAALLLAAVPAIAQQVYRCGPDASSYSQQPCADGKALDVSDPRSAAQRREAHKAAARNEKQADAMQREREQAERRIKPASAASLSAPPPKPPPVAAKAPKAAASKPTIYLEPVKPKTSPQ